jgi:hypothetical protein
MIPLVTLFWLLVGHAVADYPLQGDFLARAKNHRQPLPGVPWQICLVAHALIHAGAVMAITHNLILALSELSCHIVIDFCKSEGWYGFAADQALHVVCKILWVALLFLFR